MTIYEPAEDSYLLQSQLGKHLFGRILDMGTGSGIQALNLIKNSNVREVIAADINKEAINQLEQEIKVRNLRKIKTIHTNLFENITGKFNFIVFNPPYLPQDEGIKDQALYGGKEGFELAQKFFSKASKYLEPDGTILFLFSSLTNKEKINQILKDHLLTYKQIDSQKLSFEELYVYEITKLPLLRDFELHQIENISYLTSGKRGVIYIGVQDKSRLVKTHITSKPNIIKVAIKTKKEESKARNTIQNEVTNLKLLNKRGIGPRLIFATDTYFVYKFVEGEFILDYIKHNKKPTITKVLENLLNQCLTLDKLQINKEEMHHPLKHIIINKENQPVMIDFERATKTTNPKNLTQFIEFICRLKEELEAKDFTINVEELRELAKNYKQTRGPTIINQIITLLK